MPFRTSGPSRSAPRRLWAIGFFILLTTVGCRPSDEVSKYTAPKDPIDIDLISDDPDEGQPSVRILGAIAEAGKPGEESWYIFKFQSAKPGIMYTPKAIERHKVEFDAFMASLKFPAEGNPTWTLPAGWRAVEVKTGFPRLATFRMRKSETIVDLAISDAKGSLLDNINRWRVQQAGAEAITEAEIDKKCEVKTIDGHKVVIVDVSGPGGQGGMMVPPHGK